MVIGLVCHLSDFSILMTVQRCWSSCRDVMRSYGGEIAYKLSANLL